MTSYGGRLLHNRLPQDGDYNDDHLENLLADFDYGHPPGVHSLFSKCVNTCCTGAHVQEVIHLFIVYIVNLIIYLFTYLFIYLSI